MKEIFCKESDQVLAMMKTYAYGLSREEAKERLNVYGKNILIEKQSRSWLGVFIEQFEDLLVIILVIAAGISFISGNKESTVIILIVLILNAALGTVQYFKAEKSLASLRALTISKTKVIRGGEQFEIASEEIVPGDIIILEAGDLISADGRIIENFNLQVNESSLTGESESINKQSSAIDSNKEISLGEQKNMVFSGSLVTYGRAKVVVTGVGMNTEIGKIASLMNKIQDKQTPLQKSLDEFSKKLAIMIVGICIVVFFMSVYRHMIILDALMFAVALAVAAIPEALGSIVTIVLAMGTQGMARQNAIVKELKAVESLGCVSVICSDKTGTLTQNKMTVWNIFRGGKEVNKEFIDIKSKVDEYLIKASVLCNDSITRKDLKMGDPTEIALVDLAERFNIDEEALRKECVRLGEVAFDSNRKLMSTLQQVDDKYIIFTKGAPDILVTRCKYVEMCQGRFNMGELEYNEIIEANEKFSKKGLRVLGIAYKEINSNRVISAEDEYEYTFLGLIAMIDPPRQEVKEAVERCKIAGIRPIMITGDHKVTASSIGKELGILNEGQKAVEGIDIDAMTDDELASNIEDISVYARVSPTHKIRIVEAWQRKGKIVAMTGDGVNDAPALKRADIGIAMGITGTEVSKDAADMILTDDNFATVVKAIESGRNIFSNIKHAVQFLLSGNTAGILCVLFTSLIGFPMPFAAVQLLFINLVTDSLPAIAIGVEKSREDLLKQKPRNPHESLLDKTFIKVILAQGMLIAVFTMLSYYVGFQTGGTQVAMTMAFGTLCFGRLLHGFNCRGEGSLIKLGVLSNKMSLIAFLGGSILLNIVLFIPFISKYFQISSLNMEQIIRLYGFAIVPTICIQMYRVIYFSLKGES